MIMGDNDDKILHCLLKHKAVLTDVEKKILSELERNNIMSDVNERNYCLENKYFIHSVGTFENSQGGWTAISQTSLSSLGETEIKRLWANSRLNPLVKKRKRFLWVLSKIILPLLYLLLTVYLGYIFGKQ